MIFRETPLKGAFLIEYEPISDERGHFERTYCAKEFAAHGIVPRIAQISMSFNLNRGTLRGLHFQSPPYQEAKTIRCLAGAAYDVIVDLRAESTTYAKWYGTTLSAKQQISIHVPTGFAHGFITLEENTLLEYLISDYHISLAARGIRFDDPTLAIDWPIQPAIVSPRDLALPSLMADSP
jgi:dTDP-4-dehydrorhamnose 3,5-epimerase